MLERAIFASRVVRACCRRFPLGRVTVEECTLHVLLLFRGKGISLDVVRECQRDRLGDGNVSKPARIA